MNWAMERATIPIADHYGKENQLRQLQEECGELIQAVSKHLRGKDPTGEKLMEELADVEVMIAQIKYLLGPDTAHKIESIAACKIIREKERIAEEAARTAGCTGDSCPIPGAGENA